MARQTNIEKQIAILRDEIKAREFAILKLQDAQRTKPKTASKKAQKPEAIPA